MTDMLFLKPAAGRIVRDPITREALPEVGRKVPRSAFWIRRLADGDVVEASPTASPAALDKKPGK